MIAAVKIVPSEDGDSTVVSAGEQVWRKKYPSMPDATTEAVELRIKITANVPAASWQNPPCLRSEWQGISRQ
jgi:hypothetical protein